MRNEFTAIVDQDGLWYVAYCAEVPGANGQGKSREECLANLREAIAMIRPDSAANSRPPEAVQPALAVHIQPLALRLALDRIRADPQYVAV